MTDFQHHPACNPGCDGDSHHLLSSDIRIEMLAEYAAQRARFIEAWRPRVNPVSETAGRARAYRDMERRLRTLLTTHHPEDQ